MMSTKSPVSRLRNLLAGTLHRLPQRPAGSLLFGLLAPEPRWLRECVSAYCHISTNSYAVALLPPDAFCPDSWIRRDLRLSHDGMLPPTFAVRTRAELRAGGSECLGTCANERREGLQRHSFWLLASCVAESAPAMALPAVSFVVLSKFSDTPASQVLSLF